MAKRFNLSDLEEDTWCEEHTCHSCPHKTYSKESVQKFFKELKKVTEFLNGDDKCWVESQINELAGDKLKC